MKKRKSVPGKFCEWPERDLATRPCLKPAYVYMINSLRVQADAPGRWCCGIHENAGHTQGWTETGAPDEQEEGP